MIQVTEMFKLVHESHIISFSVLRALQFYHKTENPASLMNNPFPVCAIFNGPKSDIKEVTNPYQISKELAIDGALVAHLSSHYNGLSTLTLNPVHSRPPHSP